MSEVKIFHSAVHRLCETGGICIFDFNGPIFPVLLPKKIYFGPRMCCPKVKILVAFSNSASGDFQSEAFPGLNSVAPYVYPPDGASKGKGLGDVESHRSESIQLTTPMPVVVPPGGPHLGDFLDSVETIRLLSYRRSQK